MDTSVLMQSVPDHISLEKIEEEILKIRCVEDLHHVHAWSLNERDVFYEGHVRIAQANIRKMEEIKRAIKCLLKEKFGISHSTLEFELEDCDKGVCRR